MNIKTKYDIGDKVWPIGRVTIISRRWICWQRSRIIKPEIFKAIIKDGELKNIQYPVSCCYKNKCGGTNYREERDLFPTKKAAQAECDRRNKECS